MKSSKKHLQAKLTPLFCLACLAALGGCSDDSASKADEKDCKVTGTCDVPSEECSNNCTPNQYQCDDRSLAKCIQDEKGCYDWKFQEECLFAADCDADLGQCRKGCEDACAPDAFRCDGSWLTKCEPSDNGCYDWKSLQDCGEASACDESLGQCQSSCTDACTLGENKCDSGNIVTCIADDNGCAVWEISKECGSNTHCDESSVSCVEGCIDECTEGDTICADGGIKTCGQYDEDTCTEWSSAEPCGADKQCDSEGKSCEKNCTDACTEGETKCDGEKIMTCEAPLGTSCTTWSEAKNCEMGQRCENNACTYTCGSDCEPFSIILIPDTQYYTRGLDPNGNNNGYGTLSYDKSTYPKAMKWIKDNKSSHNIRFAIHLGDITDRNIKEQWELANKAHKTYLDGIVPYTVATGNHDYLYDSKTKLNGEWVNHTKQFATRSNSKFSDYFNNDRLKGKPSAPIYFLGHNSYATFAVGGIKFLVLALEFDPRKDTLCKANEIIAKYPDHHIIIETHSYLQKYAHRPNYKDKGGWSGKGYAGGGGIPLHIPNGATGWQTYRELVARHSNVFMVVSGHINGSSYREVTGHNGNKIHEMLIDYQDEKPCTSGNCFSESGCNFAVNGGNGWLRELKIDPKTGKVTSSTFTVLDKKDFVSDSPQLYCSHNSDNTEYKPDTDYLDSDYEELSCYPTNYTHAQHAPSFTYDFGKTPEYQYKEDPTGSNPDIGFTTRGINSKSTRDQIKPAVAVHRQDGHFVAVWQDDSSSDDGNDGNGKPNYDIEARIFCPLGCEDVAQFTINKTTSGNQLTPDVGMDKDGNFVVVWADDSDGDGKFEISMRGFKSDGTVRFEQKTVNTNTSGQQLMPKIAMADNGQFVVAWHDESVSANTPQVLIRGFNADGTQLFADENVEGATEGKRTEPAIAMAPDGHFVVAWTDDPDANDATQLRVKVFNADGTQRIKSFNANTVSTRDQRKPGVAMNKTGSFFVTWEDERDTKGIFRIYGRGFDADGKENVAETAYSASGSNAKDPVVCMSDDAKTNAMIVWSISDSKKDKASYCFVNASLCDDLQYSGVKNGAASTSVNRITNQYHQHIQPAIGCTSKGKPRVVWADDYDGNGTFEILGTGYNSI